MEELIILENKELRYGQKLFTLDERHLLLWDGQDRAARECPWCFESLDALLASGRLKEGSIQEPMTVYIGPSVYWITEPGGQEVLQALPGDWLPYEKKITCSWLRFIGLSDNPAETVIAGDKGQAHGCVGNYTMFHFMGDGLCLENLTIGNYCSVDLEYPAAPEKSRKKRCTTITQAQLGDVEGDCFMAKNCRFVSRLNLYPICGAKRSLYVQCHFECTDDALNGNAVYLNCDFDFYGGRPISHTDGTGSVFYGCLFRIRGHLDKEEADQYFMKGQGTVYVISCRFADCREEAEQTEPLRVEWTRYPEAETVCYEAGNKQEWADGLFIPLRLGASDRDTVELSEKQGLFAFLKEDGGCNVRGLLAGEDDWNPLAEAEGGKRLPVQLRMNQTRICLASGQESSLILAEAFYFSGERAMEGFKEEGFIEEASGEEVSWEAYSTEFSLEEALGCSVEIRKSGQNGCFVTVKNETGSRKRLRLLARTRQGLLAMAVIEAEAAERETPGWQEEPSLLYQDGCFELHYKLSQEAGCPEETDCSEIEWYLEKDGRRHLAAVSREGVQALKYAPLEEDQGCVPVVKIRPKTSCSRPGEPVEISFGKEITKEQISFLGRIQTDFADFPTSLQPEACAGYWTRDFYTPKELGTLKEWRKWTQDLPEEPWAYGELGNGCRGKGLYPRTQGVKLFYTFGRRAEDMQLLLTLDPAKTAGQGFGSAGQYLDVCIRFDGASLSGPALRIMRTPEASDAVAMLLVAYHQGIAEPVTELVYTSCFVTGCYICLETSGETFSARAYTEKEIRAPKEYKEKVHLKGRAVPGGSAFGVLNTGSCGDEGWHNAVMLHSIQAQLLPG